MNQSEGSPQDRPDGGDRAPRGKGLPEVVATMGLVTTRVVFLGAVPPSGGSSLPHPHCSSVFPPVKWADRLGAVARLPAGKAKRRRGFWDHNHLTGQGSVPREAPSSCTAARPSASHPPWGWFRSRASGFKQANLGPMSSPAQPPLRSRAARAVPSLVQGLGGGV